MGCVLRGMLPAARHTPSNLLRREKALYPALFPFKAPKGPAHTNLPPSRLKFHPSWGLIALAPSLGGPPDSPSQTGLVPPPLPRVWQQRSTGSKFLSTVTCVSVLTSWRAEAVPYLFACVVCSWCLINHTE